MDGWNQYGLGLDETETNGVQDAFILCKLWNIIFIYVKNEVYKIWHNIACISMSINLLYAFMYSSFLKTSAIVANALKLDNKDQEL